MVMKKRRGLGFGPEKHHEQAIQVKSRAEDQFSEAAKSAKAKKCGNAFFAMIQGEYMAGMAASESWAASNGRDRYATADFVNRDEAYDAISENCLVNRSLSGLGRRPSRRSRRK